MRKQYAAVGSEHEDLEGSSTHGEKLEYFEDDDDDPQVEDEDNEEFKPKSILNKSGKSKGSSSTTGEKKQVRIAHLDEKKKMKQMEIEVSGERAPTQVGHRRRLAMIALAMFFGILFSIVVFEDFLQEAPTGVRAQHARARNRNDVVLVSFQVDDKPLTWESSSVLEGKEFATALVEEFSKIPFHDFSIEFQFKTSLDFVEIACVEEEDRSIPVASNNCTEEQSGWIHSFAELPIERCSDDVSSAFRNAIKCYKSKSLTSPAEDEQLVQFFQTVFAKAKAGDSFTSRCCDFDQVYVDVNKHNTLEICSARLEDLEANKVNFLRYFGKEEKPVCKASMCGCTCFADSAEQPAGSSVRGQSGCPLLPEKLKGQNLCLMVTKFLGRQPLCTELPVLAKNYKKVLERQGVSLGENPRCYGTYSVK